MGLKNKMLKVFAKGKAKVKNEFDNRIDGKNAHEKLYMHKIKENKIKNHEQNTSNYINNINIF